MLTQTDTLAAERFRTILAEGISQTGYDAYGAGEEADPDRVAHAVLDDFSEFRFERRVNEHGVAVRRVVVASGWEVDPDPSARCEPGIHHREHVPGGDLIREWLATYPTIPDDVTGDPEAVIVAKLRRILA